MNFKFRHFQTNVQIEKGSMDITPLIDVVFQLIIFFLLSSSFVLQPGIKVELPETRLSSGEKPAGLSVSVLKNGRIFFKDKEINLRELGRILKEEKTGKSYETFIIKADQKTDHGTVVKIMGIAKQVGIAKIAIATKPDFSTED